jgi:predicted nucleic acid-binding protein
MEWVEHVTGQIVGLDTAPLIYYVEAHPTYLPLVDPFFTMLERGEVHGLTSIVTLIETTIRPMRNGNAELVARYEDLLLDTANIDTIDLSAPIAQEAARLRATYNLRTPDAIQLATQYTPEPQLFSPTTRDSRSCLISPSSCSTHCSQVQADDGSRQWQEIHRGGARAAQPGRRLQAPTGSPR